MPQLILIPALAASLHGFTDTRWKRAIATSETTKAIIRYLKQRYDVKACQDNPTSLFFISPKTRTGGQISV